METTETTNQTTEVPVTETAIQPVQRRGYKRAKQAAIHTIACGCWGTSRRGPVQLPDGSWAVVCYWGPASHPEDARLHLRGGETLIGVQAVDAALGIA